MLAAISAWLRRKKFFTLTSHTPKILSEDRLAKRQPTPTPTRKPPRRQEGRETMKKNISARAKASGCMRGYHSEKIVAKFAAAFIEALQGIKSGEIAPMISISWENSKMGGVASVSTLPFITCPGICNGTCAPHCYAAKLANLRPAVMKAYARNTAIYYENPAAYWAQIDAAAKAVRFFRWHVSGDIVNRDYFEHMVEIARENPHCQFLAFTKRFDAVNAWISGEVFNEYPETWAAYTWGRNDDCSDWAERTLPENLHILFSGWDGMKPENPYNLPETDVIMPGAF